jgi:hypothetical protein
MNTKQEILMIERQAKEINGISVDLIRELKEISERAAERRAREAAERSPEDFKDAFDRYEYDLGSDAYEHREMSQRDEDILDNPRD